MTHKTIQRQGETKVDPKIYVADLADYNAGILRGRWISIEEHTEIEDIQAEIWEMLREKGHEEYAIHDYEDMPGNLGECPSLKDVISIARAVHESGYSIVDAYLSHFGIDELEMLDDRFRGIYEDVEDYARELINECYNLEKMMGSLAYYFDYEAFARDLELNSEILGVYLGAGQTAIFAY